MGLDEVIVLQTHSLLDLPMRILQETIAWLFTAFTSIPNGPVKGGSKIIYYFRTTELAIDGDQATSGDNLKRTSRPLSRKKMKMIFCRK